MKLGRLAWSIVLLFSQSASTFLLFKRRNVFFVALPTHTSLLCKSGGLGGNFAAAFFLLRLFFLEDGVYKSWAINRILTIDCQR